LHIPRAPFNIFHPGSFHWAVSEDAYEHGEDHPKKPRFFGMVQ
jgi:hypothetical protein